MSSVIIDRRQMAAVPPPNRARVTVIDRVVHHGPGSQPVEYASQFSRSLRSDEQPYHRPVKVTHEWRRLDVGWVDQAGMLVFQNDEGRNPIRVPSKEELEEIEQRYVEVTFDPSDDPRPSLVVPPGESCRFFPVELSVIRVRCLHGMARCVLTLVPR